MMDVLELWVVARYQLFFGYNAEAVVPFPILLAGEPAVSEWAVLSLVCANPTSSSRIPG